MNAFTFSLTSYSKNLSSRETFEKFYRLDDSDSDSENSEEPDAQDEDDEHFKAEEDSLGEE